ncbi:MAG TPA: HPr family phosphocarrier protein [Fervidobacterium sp.]|mgnify:FL=1|jgi:phosphocarrier protein|nr:HPr family phosphocarrier protein [Fervidobacterium sp.]HOL03701.1 HPr family phosphocarrier protein [Fervidobacterium sp.]HOS51402.1 HPr family phosphocarrier protein [Fervidobacterium sp.]HQG02165.1 HPr family phosphocarrier protein [Fervidobacterium sp.]HQI08740.1 HPr family phosphocarrier protein [Fervidobacterium sp.]
MLEAKIVLKNQTGLHARPASILVTEAGKFKSDIYILKDGREINAKSILGVLSMGARKGDEITIRISGEDEEQALSRLTELLENFEE